MIDRPPPEAAPTIIRCYVCDAVIPPDAEPYAMAGTLEFPYFDAWRSRACWMHEYEPPPDFEDAGDV